MFEIMAPKFVKNKPRTSLMNQCVKFFGQITRILIEGIEPNSFSEVFRLIDCTKFGTNTSHVLPTGCGQENR